MPAQIGFLVGFKNTDIWLFPDQIPDPKNLTLPSITYTMSGDTKSLRIGTSGDVGDLVKAITGSTTIDLTSQLKLPNPLPEPFKSLATTLDNAVFFLDSLRLTVTPTTSGATTTYKCTYEVGVSVDLGLTVPAPFNALSLKRLYLKLSGSTG